MVLPPPPLHPETEGVRHVLAAAGFSFAGLRWMLRETAFRHELVFAVLMLGAFGLAGASLGDAVVQIGLLLMLLAVEALNTAIERIVDRFSPELSIFAKEAKDLSSFAVFWRGRAARGDADGRFERRRPDVFEATRVQLRNPGASWPVRSTYSL